MTKSDTVLDAEFLDRHSQLAGSNLVLLQATELVQQSLVSAADEKDGFHIELVDQLHRTIPPYEGNSLQFCESFQMLSCLNQLHAGKRLWRIEVEIPNSLWEANDYKNHKYRKVCM